MSRRIGWVVAALWLGAVGCASDPSFDDPPFDPTQPAPPLNRPPVLGHVTARTTGTSPVAVDLLAGASDPDGDLLTVSNIFTFGAGVYLRDDGHTAEVTPQLGLISTIAVTYYVDDGHFHLVPGEADITVVEPPFATDATIAVATNVPGAVSLQASDPGGLPLTYTIVTQPRHGTLSGTAPNLTYTPAQDFVGSDQLTFSVSDGTVTSNLAIVTLNVSRANHPPLATPQAVPATEDTPVPVTLTGSDPDGDPLSFEIVLTPSHGVLLGVGPNVIYSPTANYHGPDSFSFVTHDGHGASSPLAAVSIDVASVNDAPVAGSQQRSVAEDESLAITLLAGDADGDAISYAITSAPAHGTLTGTPPSVVYQPAANYHGPDAFTFTVSDGTATSLPATVTLTVGSVDDAPVALDGAVTTDEDVPVAITLQASDVEGDPLTYTVIDKPSDGSLVGFGASWTYTPAANASGTRTLTFEVEDGVAVSGLATVTITINPIEDPPAPVDDYAATDVGQALTVDLLRNDLEVDGEALTISALGAPAHGTAAVVAGKLRYTPAAGFTGVDVFAYTASDTAGLTASATVHVGVGTFPPGAPLETVLALAVNTADPTNAPSLSSDGRFVAFTSTLALDPADTNGFTDVYLYDRGDRSVTWISQSPTGVTNGASRNPRISGNGRFIVFDSNASSLVAGDSNAANDVFRHDRITGETVRISVSSTGGQATGTSIAPSVSDDGNRVAFTSTAFDLVANDANGASDIFVRDVAAGTTTRVSVSNTNGEGDLSAVAPAISGDGKVVAFSSAATNLVAGDTNHVSDVFVRELAAGTTTRVSVSSTGGEANSASGAAALSQDGRFIAFRSDATNLVSGGTFGTQVFVRDTQAQTTTRPVQSGSVQSARLSGDGRYLAVQDDSGVRLCDRFAAVTVQPPGAASWRLPSWSSDGHYLVVLGTAGGGTLLVTPNPL